MLRKINETLFSAPRGRTIQLVVESQGNNTVNEARFEYAGEQLDPERIGGLPGCTFTVADTREILEAGVVFAGGVTGARYDMFEVENGVRSPLDKSVRSSEASPIIAFTIRPDAAPLGMAAAPGAPPPAMKQPAAKKKKKKAAAKKKTAKKKAATKKAAAKKKTAPKKKTKTSRKAPK